MNGVALEHIAVTKALYLGGYVIHVKFNDGTERDVDFGPFLARARNPDTTDYRGLAKFKSFRIEDGDLIWGDYQMIFPIADLYEGRI